MATTDAWLARVQEEAIEPDLPICDAHHHLWALREGFIEPRYLLDELFADLNSGHNIVSTVYAEVRSMHRADGPVHLRPVGEIEFANGMAAMSASGLYGKTQVAKGIVGYVDLTGELIGEALDAMIAAAPARFRGIRQPSAWDADVAVRGHRKNPRGLYLDEAFRAGARELARRDLTFDAWSFHPQLSELVAFARAVPGLQIVCDHDGGPIGIGAAYAGRRAEILAEWKRSMAELATCPNVAVKLGGIFMEVNGFAWHQRPEPPNSDELAAAARPYHEFLIETFGADRCIFESNFPIEKISCSYGVLWNSFKKITRNCSNDEKAKLYHDNAARVYRLA